MTESIINSSRDPGAVIKAAFHFRVRFLDMDLIHEMILPSAESHHYSRCRLTQLSPQS